MQKCKWYNFHSFEKVYKYENYFYYGENLKREIYSGFKRCKKCGKIKEYKYDSQGGCYVNITEAEQDVLNSKITRKENGIFLEGIE